MIFEDLIKILIIIIYKVKYYLAYSYNIILCKFVKIQITKLLCEIINLHIFFIMKMWIVYYVNNI